MKLFRFCFIFVVTVSVGVHTFAKDAPQKTLDKKAVDRVATFTKVWGLMKYYHPGVAAGTLNWDSVFVAYVPKVESSKSKKEFSELMDQLYTSVPAPTLAPTYNLPKADTITSVFSTKEIARYNSVSPALKKQLTALYERHLPTQSKYITNKYKEYTLDYVLFQEEPMAEMAYPGKESRLLALARYWNTINFFYPHKQTIGKNWGNILEQYIPVFADAPTQLAYHLSIQRINKELKDSHSFVNSPTINSMWGPNPYFMVSYIENKFVITKIEVDSIAKVQDIKVGDVITGINGKLVQERVKELWPILAGSNEAATYRDIANYLLNVDGNNYATIEIQRGNNHITKKITRLPYQELVKLAKKPQQQSKLWRELETGIMYVDYAKIKKPDTLQALFTDLNKAKTVILDLRGYPNFQVYLKTLPALFAKSFLVSYTSNPLVTYPGLFSVSKSIYERADTSNLLPYNGKMVVLVNEHTQSLPESFAFGLAQRPNTIIMGSQTAGTTGNITWLSLPGGANVAFTGVGERGANNTYEQRKGVRINKVVKPTLASVVAGRDDALEAAIVEARKSGVVSIAPGK